MEPLIIGICLIPLLVLIIVVIYTHVTKRVYKLSKEQADNPLISAIDANSMVTTTAYIQERLETQRMLCKTTIYSAIADNEYLCNLPNVKLHPIIISELRALGYTVHEYDLDDCHGVNISFYEVTTSSNEATGIN